MVGIESISTDGSLEEAIMETMRSITLFLEYVFKIFHLQGHSSSEYWLWNMELFVIWFLAKILTR